MNGKHEYQCNCIECIRYMETELAVDVDLHVTDNSEVADIHRSPVYLNWIVILVFSVEFS